MDLNSSGSDHYAQNHPRETLPVSRLVYLLFYYLLILLRTQNLYIAELMLDLLPHHLFSRLRSSTRQRISIGEVPSRDDSLECEKDQG